MLPVLLAGCSGGPAAIEGNTDSNKPYPTVAYVATYDLSFPGGARMQQTWYSDGDGKLRLEMQGRGAPPTVTILDIKRNTGFLLMLDQKHAMKMPMNASPAQTYINEYTAKERGLESLGAKQIRGHACHGWKSVDKGMISESWVEDGSGILVESKTALPGGDSLMQLSKIEKTRPDASLFEIPPGFSMQLRTVR